MQDFNYTFTGKLSPELKLEIDFLPSIARILQPLVGIPLEITIKKFYKQRSIAQNNWIHGPCIITIQAWMKERTGSCPSHDALYAFLRLKVIGEEVVIEEIEGVDVPIITGKRFSQCTTVEFAERVEKICAYYAEQGLEIPLPQAKTNNYINNFSNYMKDE